MNALFLHVGHCACCSDFCILHIHDVWMDDLRLNVNFNSMSVISGRWNGDNERLHAMESRLGLKRYPPPGINLWTA